MAPVNIAGQPILATRELRRQGVDATLLEYTTADGHVFGYQHDQVVSMQGRHRMDVQVETLRQCLDAGYDIFHFWMATLFGGYRYGNMFGLDLPFIKARGRRIVYRGTGFDLRIPSVHAAKNPGLPALREAMDLRVDEATQRTFIEYLRDYVDLFIVQDPELHEYLPEARVVPRAVDLNLWRREEVKDTDRPLIVHAPSKSALKGSDLLESTLRELEAEGLRFELKVITGMRHDEAVQWYRRADIIVDQLLIGWYGVLTLEGLAMGKPVVVYVREDLFDRFTPRIPIQNAPPGKLKEALRELIADPRRRRELAAAGPDFVRDVHDVRKIAAMLRDIYAEVMEMPMRVPDGHADLEHFLAQFKLLEDRETLLALQFKARSYDALMTELPALRFRARKYGEARDRLRSLQFKARSYDALLSELPALRFRARRYDEMRVEHGRIRETLSAARRALHGKAAP